MRTTVNILAVLAIVAGLVIGAACHGVLAFLGAFILAYLGTVALIKMNTDWICNY